VDKEALNLQKAGILKGLAHPVRLRIVEALSKKDMCVCEIVEMFDYDRTTISKHLALMKYIGILGDRKEGLNVYYSLRMPCLASLLACVERVVSGDEPGATVFSCGCGNFENTIDQEEDIS
jgi:ArsR family transcriptional regulator